MSEDKAVTGSLPAQGSLKWYVDFLTLLENRRVLKVDKTYLQNQGIAKGNERKFISGLRFLGLIDKDFNATEALNNLSVKGEKRRENLEKVVRNAYSLLFDVAKIDLKTADADTLVNCFKTDYNMGSLTTADLAARVFVFLAQKAGISLSESIWENLSVSLEKGRAISETSKGRSRAKFEKEEVSQTSAECLTTEIPEGAMARFILRGTGYVDIKDKETFELAKGYLKILSKRLKIPEE